MMPTEHEEDILTLDEIIRRLEAYDNTAEDFDAAVDAAVTILKAFRMVEQ
jgi:hypothetical protein